MVLYGPEPLGKLRKADCSEASLLSFCRMSIQQVDQCCWQLLYRTACEKSLHAYLGSGNGWGVGFWICFMVRLVHLLQGYLQILGTPLLLHDHCLLMSALTLNILPVAQQRYDVLISR